MLCCLLALACEVGCTRHQLKRVSKFSYEMVMASMTTIEMSLLAREKHYRLTTLGELSDGVIWRCMSRGRAQLLSA